MQPEDQEFAQRRAAAARAVQEIRDGMVLGYGTGRAAALALEALASRQREGLRIRGIPSSRSTEAKARALGLPLTTFDEHPHLDLTIDGADEVDPQCRLVKGGGGALLREKVLAAASDRLLIVVEQKKLVPYLGATRVIPLEVLPFATSACLRHLRALAGVPSVRVGEDGMPFVTDNGQWVIDCTFPPELMSDVERLDRRLHAIPGLLETGFFVNFAPTVYAGTDSGVSELKPGESALPLGEG